MASTVFSSFFLLPQFIFVCVVFFRSFVIISNEIFFHCSQTANRVDECYIMGGNDYALTFFLCFFLFCFCFVYNTYAQYFFLSHFTSPTTSPMSSALIALMKRRIYDFNEHFFRVMYFFNFFSLC